MLLSLSLFMMAATPLVVPPADVSGPIFRLYSTEAVHYLDNLENNPHLKDDGGPLHNVGLLIIAKDITQVTADTALTIAQIKRARRLGLYAMPGMRLHATKNKAEPVTRAYWAKVASVAKALLKHMEGDRRFTVDVETYLNHVLYSHEVLEGYGATAASLERSMQPLTRLLTKYGVTLGVYPLHIEDQRLHALAKAVPALELWTESTFNYVENIQDPNVAAGQILRGYRRIVPALRIWPHARWRFGLTEDVLRGFGHSWRSEKALGPLQPWLFLYRRTDRKALGSPAFVSGESIDSRNDVAHAWNVVSLADNRSDNPRVPDSDKGLRRNFMLPKKGGLDNPQWPHRGKSIWTAVPQGRTLRLPLADRAPMTVGVSVRIDALPEAERTLFGARQSGIKSGDGGAWWFSIEPQTVRGRVRKALVFRTHGKGAQRRVLDADVARADCYFLVIRRHREGIVADAVDADGTRTTTGFIPLTRWYRRVLIGRTRTDDTSGQVSLQGHVFVAERLWTDDEIIRTRPNERWPFGVARPE